MNLLVPFASLGVINGIVIGFYLLFKRKSVTDIYFAGMILAFCVRIGKSVILHYSEQVDPFVLQVGLSACIFIGPFFFLYLKALRSDPKEISRGDKILLLLLLFFIIGVGVVFPYRTFPSYWNPEIVQIIYVVWAVFMVLGFKEGYQLMGLSFFTPWKLKGDRLYLVGIITAVTLITLTYQFALFLASFTYIWGAFIFSFSFYFLGFRAMKSKSIAAKPALKRLEEGDRIMQQLDALMKSEQPYKNTALKLDDLAARLSVSRHILSQALNQSKAGGYINYIRKYRIEEAKKLIITQSHLSLEGIGYEAGFRSKSSFFEAFKKTTGSTPAEYKRQATSD